MKLPLFGKDVPGAELQQNVRAFKVLTITMAVLGGYLLWAQLSDYRGGTSGNLGEITLAPLLYLVLLLTPVYALVAAKHMTSQYANLDSRVLAIAVLLVSLAGVGFSQIIRYFPYV